MRSIIILAGIILMVAAGVWQFGLRDQFNRRFPDGWRWEVSTIGQTAWADESGAFPRDTTLEDDPINITERNVAAAALPGQANAVTISDHYETRDPATNAVTWEFTYEAQVDAVSGRHLGAEYADDYYLFPRDVQKTTYNLRNTTYQGLPVSFQAEETVAGIATYKFAYYGDLENSHAYTDVTLEENQGVYCFDFQLEYWVEPATGEIVKFREWCEGDWVVNTATNERLYALSRWGGENTGDDLIRRSAEVQSAVSQYQAVNVLIPLALLAFGAALVVFGLVPMLMPQLNTPSRT